MSGKGFYRCPAKKFGFRPWYQHRRTHLEITAIEAGRPNYVLQRLSGSKTLQRRLDKLHGFCRNLTIRLDNMRMSLCTKLTLKKSENHFSCFPFRINSRNGLSSLIYESPQQHGKD
jgi:hypothetical protein